MATDDLDSVLGMSWEPFVAEETEHQRRALEAFDAKRRGREERDVVVLEDSDDEVAPPSKPFYGGDLGQGCSYAAPKDEPPDDDDDGDDGGDYTEFYGLLGMN